MDSKNTDVEAGREEGIALNPLPHHAPKSNEESALQEILAKHMKEIELKIDKQSIKIDDLKGDIMDIKFDENVEKMILKFFECRYGGVSNRDGPVGNGNANAPDGKPHEAYDNTAFEPNATDPESELKATPTRVPDTERADIIAILLNLKRTLDAKFNHQTEKMDALSKRVGELNDSMNVCSNQFAILLDKCISTAVENQPVVTTQPNSKKKVNMSLV